MPKTLTPAANPTVDLSIENWPERGPGTNDGDNLTIEPLEGAVQTLLNSTANLNARPSFARVELSVYLSQITDAQPFDLVYVEDLGFYCLHTTYPYPATTLDVIPASPTIRQTYPDAVWALNERLLNSRVTALETYPIIQLSGSPESSGNVTIGNNLRLNRFDVRLPPQSKLVILEASFHYLVGDGGISTLLYFTASELQISGAYPLTFTPYLHAGTTLGAGATRYAQPKHVLANNASTTPVDVVVDIELTTSVAGQQPYSPNQRYRTSMQVIRSAL
jgi:hypothetical protein